MRRLSLAVLALLCAAPALQAAEHRAPATQLADAPQLRAVLAAERGRVLILNLWDTYCVPCLREVPDLVRLQKQYADRGVRLLGLSMDEPGQLLTLVEPFRSRNFPEFHTYLRDAPELDTIVSVVDPAWNEILPTTYLIGRDGRVLRKIQGKRTAEQFEALINEALAASAAITG